MLLLHINENSYEKNQVSKISSIIWIKCIQNIQPINNSRCSQRGQTIR